MNSETIKAAISVKEALKNGGNRRKLLADSVIHTHAEAFVQSLLSPITEGSEKQILWAEKIRTENFSRLVREYSLYLYEMSLVEAGEMMQSQFAETLIKICIRNTKSGFGSHRAADVIATRDNIMIIC